ncbi:MAG TPA: hypothetical protein VI819_03025 [Patescibacteria group bacterium]|nr:hypothetical protein [Patescibacteria group bacterium]
MTTRSIESLFRTIHKEKGNNSERRIRSALELLKDKKKLDGVIHSRGLDIKGVDFEIRKGRKRYKLSVKSSWGGINAELEKHPERYRHGDIIFIIPGESETSEDLSNRIILLINEFERRMHAS